MFDFFNTSEVTSLLLCGALDRIARRCIREQVLERTLQKCFHTLFTNIKNAFVSPVLGLVLGSSKTSTLIDHTLEYGFEL